MKQEITPIARASQVVEHATHIVPTAVAEADFTAHYRLYHVTIIRKQGPTITAQVSSEGNKVFLYEGVLTTEEVEAQKGFMGSYFVQDDMQVIDLDEKVRHDFAIAIASGSLH